MAHTAPTHQANSNHTRLQGWVDEVAALTQPDDIYWCDGSDEEYDQLAQTLIDAGTFERLSDAKRPNSYLALSDPADVARVEDRTFICSREQDDAGPTNNWCDPEEMREALTELFRGSMRGRTMYVVPFSMGPIGSPISYIGVQLTDSAYVAASMRIMTRMGQDALDRLGDDGEFVPCLHSVGRAARRRGAGRAVAVQRREQVHRALPRDPRDLVVRVGLRRQRVARQEVLRAADRLGDGARRGLAGRAHADPQADLARGREQVHRRCVPERLRQDQPVDDDPDAARLEGRDDRRRHRVDEVRHGRPAVRGQPRGGLLRGRAGDEQEDEPERARRCSSATSVFTNCAKTDDGDIWWEGMGEPPAHAIDWRGDDWTPESESHRGASERAVHGARSRSARRSHPSGTTRPACRSTRCCSAAGAPPSCRSSTRRATGSTACSSARRCPRRRPPRPAGAVGKLRFDPMAMLPFCGYNMADYFAHWLEVGRRKGAQLPRIFYVNWFRKDDDGKFLWPGFGENSRVLAWIFRRLEGSAEANETAIGLVPPVGEGGIDTAGSTIERGGGREAARGRSRGLDRSSSRRCTSTTASSATGCPDELRSAARRARAAPARRLVA